jgi:hypothetical protein
MGAIRFIVLIRDLKVAVVEAEDMEEVDRGKDIVLGQ